VLSEKADIDKVIESTAENVFVNEKDAGIEVEESKVDVDVEMDDGPEAVCTKLDVCRKWEST
jgi:hypothetical protein